MDNNLHGHPVIHGQNPRNWLVLGHLFLLYSQICHKQMSDIDIYTRGALNLSWVDK